MTGYLLYRSISLREAKQRAQQLFPQPMTQYQTRLVQTLTQLTLTQGTDKLVWKLEASGIFSVRSIYRILAEGGKTKSDITSIWRAPVTPSMRLFFYLFLKHRLLTHEIMHKRNLTHQPGCVMCDRQHPETAMHIFFSCSYANTVWSVMAGRMGHNVVILTDSPCNTYRSSIPADRDQRRPWTTLFVTTLWFLWRERNARTFRHISTPAPLLANRIWEDAVLFLRHCN